MRFGKTLKTSIYEPWRSHYIDYAKLKKMLREDEASKDAHPSSTSTRIQEWTEEDESAFVEQLVNVQLEKVNAFHVEMYKQLQERTSQSESKLEKVFKLSGKRKDAEENAKVDGHKKADTLSKVLQDLDNITKEINELEKYSRLNFTGFLKAAKKHDRRRGTKYRVRPLLQVRLAALPFNTEDYSPLLYRFVIKYLYNIIVDAC